jgi:hypothetical protein
MNRPSISGERFPAGRWKAPRTMKRLLLVLLVATSSVANARDVEREIEQLTKDTQELGRNRSNFVANESKLKSRLQKLPANSPQAERTKAELDETRQVLTVLTEREHENQDRLRDLRDSPEHRITTAIARDNRQPTRADVSGVWTSGPSLAGYTVQLEQRGQSVTGQGFYWGCLGTYDTFHVSGSYRNDVLSLTFRVSPLKKTKHVYRYSEERRLPRFQVSESKYNERMMPSYELRRAVLRGR